MRPLQFSGQNSPVSQVNVLPGGRPVRQRHPAGGRESQHSAKVIDSTWLGCRKVEINREHRVCEKEKCGLPENEGYCVLTGHLSIPEALMIAHGLWLIKKKTNLYSFDGISSVHKGLERLMVQHTGKKSGNHTVESQSIYRSTTEPKD